MPHRYRGRSTVRRIAVVLSVTLILLMVLAAVLFVTMQSWLSYTENGVELRPPDWFVRWFPTPEPSEEPLASPTADPIIIIEPTQTPAASPSELPEATPEPTPEPERGRRPEVTRAVWVTQEALADPQALDAVIALYENTEINTLVIDVKAETGLLCYPSSLASARQSGASAQDEVMLEGIRRLQAANIPLIARISCFKDNLTPRKLQTLSIQHASGVNWLDYQYHAWLNPDSAAREYLYEIISEVAGLGIRDFWLEHVSFPVLGKLDAITYNLSASRQEVLGGFLQGAAEMVHAFDGVLYTAADVSLFQEEGEAASLYYTAGGQSVSRFTRWADALVVDLQYPFDAGTAQTVLDALVSRAAGTTFVPSFAYRRVPGSQASDAVLLELALTDAGRSDTQGYIVSAQEYPPEAFTGTAG